MIHMTPAYFKATREELGLPVAWLARRWNVRRQSVDRWEYGERAIPGGIAQDLQALDDYTCGIIDEKTHKADPVLAIPKGADEQEDGMPASWHRLVAKRVADHTGARIEYEEHHEQA